MELRDGLALLWRRRALVALATVMALAGAGVLAVRGPRAYEATVRVSVSVGGDCPPQVSAEYYCPYYNWLTSEYLADDLSEVILSDAFLTDVRALLTESERQGAVRNAVRVRKTHRLLDVTVQAGNAQEAERLGFAMAEVLQNRGALYMRQLASSSGHVAILDQPKPRPSTTTGSLVADLTLRGALGLVAGLFLAFAADYFDTTLRSRREVERLLDLPILAEVPALAR